MASCSHIETTTVLLRAAARLARVRAALLIVAGEFEPRSVFGLDQAAGRALFASLESGTGAPGFAIVSDATILFGAEGTRSARLLLLDPAVVELHAGALHMLEVMHAEIAAELDSTHPNARAVFRAGFGDRLESLAHNIDANPEPAAIMEASAIDTVPRFLYVNAAFEAFFGFTLLDVLGSAPDVLHGALTDRGRIEYVRDRVHGDNSAKVEVVLYKRDGVPNWVEVSMHPIARERGEIAYIVTTFRDVTVRKEFEAAVAAEKRKLQVTLAAIGDGVVSTVSDGRVEFINDAARSMLRIDPSDAYGESLRDLLDLRVGIEPLDLVREAIAANGVVRGEAETGTGAAVRAFSYAISPTGSEADGYVVVLRDITEQKRVESQLFYEASHDTLTGLTNRRKFEDVLEATIRESRADGSVHTLAFLDLDHFKVINDECGHASGDRALREIAEVIGHELRDRDELARLGGDEFAIVLRRCTLEHAERVREKVMRAVRGYSLVFEKRRYRLGVSIGFALIEPTTRSSSAVLAVADAACYAAKVAGRAASVG